MDWIRPDGTTGQDFFTIVDLTTNTEVVNYFGTSPGAPDFFIPGGTFTSGDSYVSELIFDDFVQNGDVGLPIFERADLRTLDYFTVPAGAVPEPATWAMLLLGFGGFVGATRSARRRGPAHRTYSG